MEKQLEIEAHVEIITPQLAQKYLQQNTDNYRKLSRSKVRAYAEDMINDRWQMNGEPIVFGKNGKLKDGQNRLAAVMMAKKPVQMLVVRGIDNDISLYDVGSNRTTNHIARASGIDLPPQAIAAAKIIVNRFSASSKGKELDYIKDNQNELLRAYRATCNGTGGRKISQKASCVAASFLMLKTKTLPFYELEIFWKVFCTCNTTGTDGYEVSPALVARHMFDQRFKGSCGSMAQKEQLEIIVMSLLDFSAGKKREQNYKIKTPFQWEALIKKIMNVA